MFRIKQYTVVWFLVVTLTSITLTLSPKLSWAQEKGEYQVVVVGGEPEGIAAALSAARNGAHTLLITEDRILGGTMTLANLTTIDMNYGPQKELLTKGIFEQFFSLVKGDSFDVKKARQVFTHLTLQEKKLEVNLGTKIIKPIFQEGGKILIGLEVDKRGKKEIIYGKRFIDATADGDLATLAGVPYTVGKEDLNLVKKTMAPTLVFQVGGGDWAKVRYHLKNDNDILSGSNKCSAWGYNKEMRSYKPLDPQIRVRGLNMGRQEDGSLMINAMLIFNVDPLNPISRNHALLRGQKEAVKIVEYLKESAYGFENAYLIGTAEKLYVRESRHIKGEYQLTIDDVLDNRSFIDKIALGSYPVDVQAAYKEENGYIIGVPKQYSIPFRCLVPLNVENLLVVGRSAAYTSLAAGSARVIPVGMVEGESAGYAAVYSIKKMITYRQLSKDFSAIKEMQNHLKKQGVYLPDFKIEKQAQGEWTYPYMVALRRIGLIVTDYKNRYDLKAEIKSISFITSLRKILEIMPAGAKPSKPITEIVRETKKPIDYHEAIKILNQAYRDYFAAIGIKPKNKPYIEIPKHLAEKINLEISNRKVKVLTRGEALALLHHFLVETKMELKRYR